jgi:hypothetical protein
LRSFRRENKISRFKTKAQIDKRAGGLNAWTAPDRQRFISRLHMKGFCNENGIPKELARKPDHHTKNAILLGLANFYLGYVRNRATIHRWIYIIRFSCLKTLAQK